MFHFRVIRPFSSRKKEKIRPTRRRGYAAVGLAILGWTVGLGLAEKSSGGLSPSSEESVLFEKLTHYLKTALNGEWQVRSREDIRQEETRYETVLTKRATGENVRRWDVRKVVKTAAVYEHRLKLKGRKIGERRLSTSADSGLLYEGREDKGILPYQASGVIFHPMEYLSRMIRSQVEFQIGERESMDGTDVQNIHFKTNTSPGGNQKPMSGTIALEPETGAVRRLRLDAENWSFFEGNELPKEFGEIRSLGHPAAKRIISWQADFNESEKRGIRFPSRIVIAESYEDALGLRVPARVWTILYTDYQFTEDRLGDRVETGDPILKKAAAYCERLKNIALQYICDEHINRKSYFYEVRRYQANSAAGAVGLPRKRWTLKRTVDRDIVYDYQLVKKNDRLEERRKALKVEGRDWTKKEEPENILPYRAQYVVYGPIGFLSASWQTGFDYFLAGPDHTKGDRETVVFVSRPNEFREDNSVYGRLWVDPESGAVIQIAWDPESIDFFHPEEVPAMFRGLEKQLIWTVEYEVEKNGIYFPSRQEIREEYIGPAGETILGDVWTVTYENYRFFTVGTDIEIKK